MSVSNVVPMSTIGARIASSLAMARKDTSTPSNGPAPANWKLSLKLSRMSSRLSMPKAHAAAILPLMMASRLAGVAKSGSSDWRSRSPAVTSITRYAPPRKALRINR